MAQAGFNDEIKLEVKNFVGLSLLIDLEETLCVKESQRFEKKKIYFRE